MTVINRNSICTTCGTKFPHNEKVPALCPICNDDRQFIDLKGQSWISEECLEKAHAVRIRKMSNRLHYLTVRPNFAIGQRAFLLQSPGGNILWDCIPLLDEATKEFIHSKGGLKAIAFSHPHFYSNMNEWAAEFNCPIYIHENDKPWIFNRGPNVKLWGGDGKPLWEGDVKGSEAPRELALDVTGAKRIEILVDYGAGLDVGDRLNLCDLRVTK